jgi:hypothetical protein
MTIFGSSNWTSPSSDSQEEHNYFTTKSWFFNWFVDQFERKWNNSTGNAETGPFTPLPPDRPSYVSPANGATGQSTTITLRWYGGPWAHVYDVYFGTSPTPPLFAANLTLGPSTTTTTYQSYRLPTLAAGTTYYWRIVSKTAANMAANGVVYSFTTSGSAPPPSTAPNIVIWASNVTTRVGNWSFVSDSSAAGGQALRNANNGAAKITPALASPSNYFEASFNAVAGTAYHLWVRLRAEGNSYSNDSLHVQFNDSVTSSGSAVARIGTSSSAEVVLQNGDGASISGWGWSDNGWGTLGTHIYFPTTGTHRLRIQQREDGVYVDQIVLSPNTYLTSPPGSRTNDSTILNSTLGGGPAPPPEPSSETLIVWATDVRASGISGNWQKTPSSSAAGGVLLWSPNAGARKITPALASPVNYFEFPVTVSAGVRYHLWVRLRSESNAYGNDSVHVQFSGATDTSGTPIYRIGTPNSAEVVLQNGDGASISGWGWNDNGWGTLGSHVYFASPSQTVRVQQREDGAMIDQIVLSPDTYLTASPGQYTNDATILPSSGG